VFARWKPGAGLRVCFIPQRPPPWYVVWSAMTLSGCRFVADSSEADAVFYFEDCTIGAPPDVPGRRVINGGCANVSKTLVASEFEAVAGYALRLDPERHVGAAVEKSEENGLHDGRIVECPTPPVSGKCYQHFIDSSDGETAYDYRTTVIDRVPRFVLVKSKPPADRFSIHNAAVEYRELEHVFTAAEAALLSKFAQKMQLDWAALDVLRDRHSGRIYVVDVNKTDTGPAVDLSSRDREQLKRAIARGFLNMVRSRGPRWHSED